MNQTVANTILPPCLGRQIPCDIVPYTIYQSPIWEQNSYEWDTINSNVALTLQSNEIEAASNYVIKTYYSDISLSIFQVTPAFGTSWAVLFKLTIAGYPNYPAVFLANYDSSTRTATVSADVDSDLNINGSFTFSDPNQVLIQVTNNGKNLYIGTLNKIN